MTIMRSRQIITISWSDMTAKTNAKVTTDQIETIFEITPKIGLKIEIIGESAYLTRKPAEAKT